MEDRKKNILKSLYFIFVFLLGALAASFLFYFDFYGVFSRAGFLTGQSINSPSNIIDTKDIIVYPDEVVIKVKGAVIDSYDSTNSMFPIIGERANGISVKPRSEDEIKVGDIITFRMGNDLYVHRVIEKGVDGEGTYFVTKGDNTDVVDGKIRFKDVEYVLVGLVY